MAGSAFACDTVSSSEVAKVSNSDFKFIKYNTMVIDLAYSLLACKLHLK